MRAVGVGLHLAPWAALLAVAALWDILKRRIPNPVNAAVAAVGLGVQGQAGGFGAVAGALGAGIAVVALAWLPWRGGKLGGGDVKLGGAAAAGVGLPGLLEYLLASAIAGGLVALVCFLLSSREAKKEMRSNLRTLRTMASGPAVSVPLEAARGRVSVPYGVSFAVGALATVAFRGGLA